MIAYIFYSFYIFTSSLVVVSASACNKYLPNQINSEQFKNLLTIFIVMLHRTEHICIRGVATGVPGCAGATHSGSWHT